MELQKSFGALNDVNYNGYISEDVHITQVLQLHQALCLTFH